MKTYKVKVNAIDYSVEEEDVCWQFDNQADLEEDSKEYYDAIHNEIEYIKATLPQTMELEIECEKEDLGDIVCDTVSEITGWLNNSVDYEILEVR